MDLTISFYDNYPNQDLLVQHLESWFTQYTPATAALQMALYKSQIKSITAQRAFATAIKPLKSIYDFARPLMNEQLRIQFGLEVDCRHLFLQDITATQPAIQADVQPILLVALRNFKADKKFHPASGLYYRTVPFPPERDGLIIGKLEEVCGAKIACSTGFIDITPTAFAHMCRSLDLGGKYLAHVDSVVKRKPELEKAFILKERCRFEVLTHIARMKGDISEEVYQVLLEVAKPDGQAVWRGGPVQYSAPELFATKDDWGTALHGVVLIESHRSKHKADVAPDNDDVALVVYMPGEPRHPIKEYPSINAFLDYLRVNLNDAHYRTYFTRFIDAKDCSAFFEKLQRVLNPDGRFDPGADLSLYRSLWDGHPFKDLYTQAVAKLIADAKVIAVPVESSGSLDTFEPLKVIMGIVHFGFHLADVFLPASEVRDLAKDVFIASEDWLEGDMEKALRQLYEIGKDLVLAAAPKLAREYERLARIYEDGKQAVEALQDLLKAAADGDANAPSNSSSEDEITDLQLLDLRQLRNLAKPSAFIEGLAQIKSEDGRVRLWKPGLESLEQPYILPSAAALDDHSLFRAHGKTWLSMGGHYYQIAFDSRLNKWRVVTLDGRQQYSPILETNGAGAWRAEGEYPMGWDAYKAFRRLHGDYVPLTNSQIRKILRITQTDEALLRQIHMDKLVPPALLIDCTQRFLIDKEVTAFIDLMQKMGAVEHSGLSDNGVVSSIEPYLDFIVTMPGWPEHRALRRVDAQGQVLSRHTKGQSASRTVDVVYTPGRMLAFLDALLRGLQPVEVESLLVNARPTPGRGQQLALRIAAQVRGQRRSLFDLLYAAKTRSADPLVKLLKRDFPSLPFRAAVEIIRLADSVELQRMSSAARIPLRLAEHAREYLQQLRINHALESLYLHMESPDSDVVSLDLIHSLALWPRDLVVEMRRNTFDGPLIYRTGGTGTSASAVNVVLVQTGTDYQTFTPQGERTLLGNSRLRTTLSNTLTSQTRLTHDVHELEELLGDLATSQRSKVKRALGMQQTKPRVIWPSRSDDGRVGYQLSGRVRGLFNRLRTNAPAFSPELAVKGLYPQFTFHQIAVFLQVLAAGSTGTAQEKKDWVRARLNELTEEFTTLQHVLDGWVAQARYAHPEPLAGVSADAREAARIAILACWRRQPESRIDPNATDSAHQLNLVNLQIGALPPITANFNHVQALRLENIALTTDGAQVFIRRFPELRRLSLSNNRIESVPEVLDRLTNLRTLTLSYNPIHVDGRGMQRLQRLSLMKVLLLEGRDINITAPLDVSRWPALLEIRLRDCGLPTLPLGLDVRETLRHVDLRRNQITDIDEQTLRAIAGRTRLYLRLHQNPLNAETVTRAAALFDEVALMRMGIGNVQADNWARSPAEWLSETGDEQQHQRWESLQREAGAEPFVLLVNDLLQTADYRDNRRLLTERLWQMIDAMAGSEALQQELFALAAHPETCGDGTMITFNMLDIRVQVFQLESLPGGKTPVDMFKLMRGLERLDELERIALEDFNARVVTQPRLDQVEVRLVYPTRLREELALPGQSQGMLFAGISGVDESMLDSARARVLARESTPEFLQSLIARKDWMTFLEDHFQKDFDKVRLPFHERQDLLDAQHETMTDDDYLNSVNAVFQELKRAVDSKALQLTTDIALLASEPA
ncbi:NEL-type E3 ubiquitin ligase domain-containing protein [Pseudomonas syringae]|uniref:RING-type E3 ubiquitin transferase n=1 Tax=Pseudomonas syringae TaxID=317 RepID=A0A085VD35_PSESX|nr:NEL-type E3 ubiquitin ligase domain-containing protein [Pseudomonas syringae]KFE53348.1 hypothetical protein IV01_20320 [Pseudomonas syringae]